MKRIISMIKDNDNNFKELSNNDFELIKESLKITIEKYEYQLSQCYDHEKKEIAELRNKINKNKELLSKL